HEGVGKVTGVDWRHDRPSASPGSPAELPRLRRSVSGEAPADGGQQLEEAAHGLQLLWPPRRTRLLKGQGRAPCGRDRSPLELLAEEELQRRLVEALGVFVESEVAEVVEHHQ